MSELDALVARLDLADPSFLDDPYPTFAALRDATPIFWYEHTRQWMLTRYREVHETLRDRRLGRVYTHRYSHTELGRPEPDPRWQAFHDHARYQLLELEPPDHTRIRQLITKVFTPKAVQALRPQIEQFSSELLERGAERERFDLVTGYAQPFSVAVICSMLGVPRSDTAQLLRWSHAIVKWYELTADDTLRDAASAAAGEFMDYVRALIRAKRTDPDGALVSQLVTVEEAGDRLSEDEIVDTTIVLLNAGHEATVNTVGNGMRAFLHHPEEWRRVTSGAVAPRTAVEEMIRWDAPLQLFERYVLDDGVSIAGQPLAVGDEVAMLFGSANRDGGRFPEPDRFDAGRGDTGHVGFGGGIHFCIGAPLARLELEVTLEGLATRFPQLALVEEPTYHPTFVIRGLTGLHVAPH
jgi:cytochrome P450